MQDAAREFDSSFDQALTAVVQQNMAAILAACNMAGVPVTVSTFKEDTQHNADYMANLGRIPISARVRKHRYLRPYGHQFTIRSRSQYGGPTEIHKIQAGHTSIMIYAFANEAGDGLAQWVILDQEVFRAMLGKVPYSLNDNYDGTQFAAFNIKAFPRKLVIARSWNVRRV